jgi:hypothetical protein
MFWILAIPLAILLLILAWTFLVPVFIPVALFHSPLLDALERSNAEIRAAEPYNITADAKEIANFFPKGLTVREAEIFMDSERFYCGPFSDYGAREAERWGNKYRHFKVCERLTHFHPLGQRGWKIYLFADRDDVIESVRAIRYYDGV